MSQTHYTASHPLDHLARMWGITLRTSQPSSDYECDHRSAIALGVISTTLATLKEASGSTPVPALRQATGLAIVILETVPGAKDNKAAYALLAEDAARLVLDIHDIVKLLDPKNLPQDLVNDLHPFIEVLRDVNQFAERRSSRKGITRFFTHKSDACEIAEYREKLKQAMDVVSVKSDIYIRIQQSEINVHTIPVSADNVPHWLPPELWRHIFRLATTEECHDMYETEYFPFQSSRYRSQSHTTAMNLFRVSKKCQALAAEFLFREVWVRHGAHGLLRSLKGSVQSEGYGRHVRHLMLPSKLVNHDAANPIRLLDILACCPHLQILVKPIFHGKQDNKFWFNLIPAAQLRTKDVILTSLKRLDWSSSGYMEDKTLEASGSILSNLIVRSPNLRYLSVLWQPGPIFKDVDRSGHIIPFPSLTTLHLAGYAGLWRAGIQPGDTPKLINLILHPRNLTLDQGDSSVVDVVGSQLRVVELLRDVGSFSTLGDHHFFTQCPNLQEFAYHIGVPRLLPLDALQHFALKRVHLRIGGLDDLRQRYESFARTGSFWRLLKREFANLSAHTFPALTHVVLHGDWNSVVQDSRFRSTRQLVLDRGCSLEYPDGTPVTIITTQCDTAAR